MGLPKLPKLKVPKIPKIGIKKTANKCLENILDDLLSSVPNPANLLTKLEGAIKENFLSKKNDLSKPYLIVRNLTKSKKIEIKIKQKLEDALKKLDEALELDKCSQLSKVKNSLMTQLGFTDEKIRVFESHIKSNQGQIAARSNELKDTLDASEVILGEDPENVTEVLSPIAMTETGTPDLDTEGNPYIRPLPTNKIDFQYIGNNTIRVLWEEIDLLPGQLDISMYRVYLDGNIYIITEDLFVDFILLDSLEHVITIVSHDNFEDSGLETNETIILNNTIEIELTELDAIEDRIKINNLDNTINFIFDQDYTVRFDENTKKMFIKKTDVSRIPNDLELNVIYSYRKNTEIVIQNQWLENPKPPSNLEASTTNHGIQINFEHSPSKLISNYKIQVSEILPGFHYYYYDYYFKAEETTLENNFFANEIEWGTYEIKVSSLDKDDPPNESEILTKQIEVVPFNVLLTSMTKVIDPETLKLAHLKVVFSGNLPLANFPNAVNFQLVDDFNFILHTRESKMLDPSTIELTFNIHPILHLLPFDILLKWEIFSTNGENIKKEEIVTIN